ncbi:helix-turn-helix domain-containing protein [Saccharothrix variisporea]|uniref:DNA-binding XRE family transcriptional regulator n=1 Tax=Saccharothrix variisporea TaxID=543527 RepID=A0A495X653_9PSEU|nr:helix-turn-helix transcriptional regulator [Saccharothrix variisporea]RKT69377.1 DNA-binding XRE family transcriptional regulator [Saccharothrix variisporea]
MYHANDNRSPLWAYIEENLAELGLVPAQLADALGIHRSRFTDWKRGKSMSVETARAMAKFLGKPILDILVVSGVLTAEEANPSGTRERSTSTATPRWCSK